MEFSLITWNVWFDLHFVKERITAQIIEILRYKPLVVCLQEMTDVILDIIKNHEELNNNYRIVSDEYSTKPYGEIMLLNKIMQTKYKYYSIPYVHTKMSRRINVLYLERFDLCVMNTHLESEFNSENTTKREQAKYLFKYAKYILCQGFAKYVLMVGDMNISKEDEQWMTELMYQYGIRDSFLYLLNDIALIPNTYDYTKNTNVKGKFKSRLDRVLFYGTACIPTNYKLIGTTAFDVNNHNTIEKCFPSDHFGIYVTFQMN
jgi:endonuclease/exonuclease/phosphatase family metal-dependent hydrolase